MPNETQLDDLPENFLVSERINVPLAEPEMILEGLWPAGQ